MRRRAAFLLFLPVLLLAVLILAGCGRPPMGELPKGAWDHVVIVVEENQDASTVKDLPYFRELRARGRYHTQSYGMARPSQPNYIALFTGSTHGVDTNKPRDLEGATLQSRLAQVGRTFAVYAEGLPSVGWRGESARKYVRKHNPAASFASVPAEVIQPFESFPADYSTLPDVSLVVPDLNHDMHDGSPAKGDTWLRTHLDAYATWARTHRSLLIVTFDEPDTGSRLSTPIYTVFVGAGVPEGTTDPTPIDHRSLLQFLLESFGAEASAG